MGYVYFLTNKYRRYVWFFLASTLDKPTSSGIKLAHGCMPAAHHQCTVVYRGPGPWYTVRFPLPIQLAMAKALNSWCYVVRPSSSWCCKYNFHDIYIIVFPFLSNLYRNLVNLGIWSRSTNPKTDPNGVPNVRLHGIHGVWSSQLLSMAHMDCPKLICKKKSIV